MSDGVVEVQLLGFPVALSLRSRQHYDELLREFALIAMGDHEGVPAQLLALTDDLLAQFARESAEMRDKVDAAERRGEEFIDLVLTTPVAAVPSVLALDAMLDKADAYCRDGAALLTLSTPPDLLAFRRWYLRQVVDQLNGRAPTRWMGPATPGAGGPVQLTAEIDLQPEPASSSSARRFVRQTLEAWGIGHLEEAAILLTSELITNALLHARTPMELRLRRVDSLLRVEVCDGNERAPVRRHYDADASTGRGLALVEAMAEEWGVDTDAPGGGKAVWFTLSLETAR